MKVYGNLERASLEALGADPSAGVTGRVWWNTASGKAVLDDGTNNRALLRNDLKCIVGNSGTASDNVRLHRGAAGVLQLLDGSDATAEGTLSAALNQLSARMQNYTTAGLPAAGNVGRLVHDTTVNTLKVDNGAAWKDILLADLAQVVTNKDIDGGTASNTSRITLPKDTKANLDLLTRKEGTLVYASDENKVYADDGATLQEIGSGSGSGLKNYITNPGAEVAVTGLVAYADAAASRPVDGTGGSPTLTATRTTTSPLSGVGSFLLTKDAANRQGEGASFDFTIDAADRGKVHTIEFDYELGGTYSGGTSSTDSDLIVYVYRTTATARLIEPVAFKITGAVNGQNYKHRAVFQADSDATGYRLIFHVATTSASAWTVKLDNLLVSPQLTTVSPAITDAVPFTMTLDATTTAPTKGTPAFDQAVWSRVGDKSKIHWEYVQTGLDGTNGTGTYILRLPAGQKIDGSKVYNFSPGQNGNGVVGTCTIYGNGNTYHGLVHVYDDTGVVLKVIDTAAATGVVTDVGSTFGQINSNPTRYSVDFEVPIVGWGSTADIMGGGEGRVVAAKFSVSGTRTPTTVKAVNYDTKVLDTHGAVTTASGDAAGWKFTAPIAGVYEVKITSQSNAAVNASLLVYKNGTLDTGLTTSNSTDTQSGSTLVQLNAGEYIDIRSDGTPTLTNSASLNTVSITRVSGPEQIQAGELVAASYYTASADVIGAGGVVNYATKRFDTHNAVTTGAGWVFTCPVVGKYKVSAAFYNGSGAQKTIAIRKNGTNLVASLDNDQATCQVDTVIDCVAGDLIQVVCPEGITLGADGTYNFISVVKM